MEDLVKTFSQLGLTGAIVVVLIYDVFFLQKKLIEIIDKNTAAISELKLIVESLQRAVERHRESDKWSTNTNV